MDSPVAKLNEEIAGLKRKLSEETIAKESALKKVEEAAHDLRVVKEELEKTIEGPDFRGSRFRFTSQTSCL